MHHTTEPVLGLPIVIDNPGEFVRVRLQIRLLEGRHNRSTSPAVSGYSGAGNDGSVAEQENPLERELESSARIDRLDLVSHLAVTRDRDLFAS